MSKLLKFTTYMFKNYPRVTQFGITGVLMGTSDVIAQTIIERKKISHLEPIRTARFSFLGVCYVGPVLQTWYTILERMIGNFGRTAGIKKVFVDQLIFAPCFLVSFIIILSSLQFHSWETIKTKLNEDYFKILKRNYQIWPAAQLITFYVCPLQFRVIFVSFVALLWNTYLASEANKSLRKSDA